MTTAWGLAIREAATAPPPTAEDGHLEDPALRKRTVGGAISSAILAKPEAPLAAITDEAVAFLTPLRGHSGELKVAFRVPGAPLAKASTPLSARYIGPNGELTDRRFVAPAQPGVYKLAVELQSLRRGIDDLSLVTLVPFAKKQQGRIGTYSLGSWPFENGGTPRSKSYADPIGFIQVTQQNQDTYVSEHFRLRDFLTKDQGNVWPKYLLLDHRLLDKLELIIQDLESRGVNVKNVKVMSGFRTPRYNSGGGNTGGRANLSRHMYGDGADIFLDNNSDGWTDDTNGDGRVDVRDSEYVAAAAERVERKYPSLVGGVGTYPACCGHGPFTHVDVRGNRARWRGSGNG